MRQTLNQDKKHRRKSRFGRKDDETVLGRVEFKVLISHLGGQCLVAIGKQQEKKSELETDLGVVKIL